MMLRCSILIFWFYIFHFRIFAIHISASYDDSSLLYEFRPMNDSLICLNETGFTPSEIRERKIKKLTGRIRQALCFLWMWSDKQRSSEPIVIMESKGQLTETYFIYFFNRRNKKISLRRKRKASFFSCCLGIDWFTAYFLMIYQAELICDWIRCSWPFKVRRPVILRQSKPAHKWNVILIIKSGISLIRIIWIRIFLPAYALRKGEFKRGAAQIINSFVRNLKNNFPATISKFIVRLRNGKIMKTLKLIIFREFSVELWSYRFFNRSMLGDKLYMDNLPGYIHN